MVILAIETSCDETAMAIIEAGGAKKNPQFKILADVVASQIETHRPYGGVVPSLAKREHLKNLPIVYNRILQKLEIRNSKLKIDRVAVTVGPGLEPCLWTGLNFAKNLSKKLKVPLIGVNHLEGHIFSNWLPQKNKGGYSNILKNVGILKNKITFPAIALLVSGGHTILALMTSMTKWKILGETRDDAVGEAFDKIAKMLGLSYPGGPEVEKLAKLSLRRPISLSEPRPSVARAKRSNLNKNLINFPRPMIHDKSYDFSFSGLKTAVLYYLRDLSSLRGVRSRSDDEAISQISQGEIGKIATSSRTFGKKYGWARDDERVLISQNDLTTICYSFQQAAIDVLVHKTIRAAKEFKAKSILLCGGVANNKALQKKLKKEIKEELFDGFDRLTAGKLRVEFHVPNMKFNTDNAVMIAAAAHLGAKYPVHKPLPNLSL